jgi:hypothetical protein
MAKAIFDPAAPIEAQLANSVSKGFLAATDRDKILAADRWLNVNWQRLNAEFPGQAVSIVGDASMEDGFATYVGTSSFESEHKARQFSPGEPYVTLDPGPIHDGPVSIAAYAAEITDWIRGSAAAFDDISKAVDKIFANQEKEEGDGDDIMAKVIEIFEKLRKDGKLPDDKLIEVFPPKLLGGASFVGGLIADGAGHENIKRWHIDTGASVSCISTANFERLQKKGAKPKQEGEVEVHTADGVKKYPKYRGIPMSFGRKDKNGKGELAKCELAIIVTEADLLGLDQLKETGTKLIIDPAGGTVELVAR